MNPLERQAATCRWSRLPVAEKLLLFGGLLLAAVLLPPWPGAALVAVVVAACVLAAGVRVRVFALALAGPLVFIAIGTVPLAMDIAGGLRHQVWFPEQGRQRALETAARSVAASSATIALACTTTMSSLLASARRAGLPAPLCHVVDLTYRLVGILVVTARALRESVELRAGFTRPGRAVAALGGQFATVFVLALQRSRRMSEAMSLRAEPGATAVAAPRVPVAPWHLLAILATLTVVCLVGITG